MEQSGLFIAVEGTDAPSAAIHIRRLAERLTSAGHVVTRIDFPQYSLNSSFFAREYLAGRYGGAETVSPYVAALFYALDRYHAANQIRDALSKGQIVIAHGFTGAAMARLGLYLQTPDERRAYISWLDNLEFKLLNIPRPQKSFVLRAPQTPGNTAGPTDAYDEITKLFPDSFTSIDTQRSGQPLSADDLHAVIWQSVEPMLPEPPAQPEQPAGQPAQAQTPPGMAPQPGDPTQTQTPPPNPYLDQTPDGMVPNAQGLALLKEVLTTSEPGSSVYGFTEAVSTSFIATILERYAQQNVPLQSMLLDTLASGGRTNRPVITPGNYQRLLRLTWQSIIADSVSELTLASMAAHGDVEHINRYPYVAQLTPRLFYIPRDLDEQTQATYTDTMNRLLKGQADIRTGLYEHLLKSRTRPPEVQDAQWQAALSAEAAAYSQLVLPLAAITSAGLVGSADQFNRLMVHMYQAELGETRDLADTFRIELHKALPPALRPPEPPQPPKLPERNAAAIASSYSSEQAPTRLLQALPRNELDLVADIQYATSQGSLEEITEHIRSVPIEQKAALLRDHLRLPAQAGLKNARYTFDVLIDFRSLRILQDSHLLPIHSFQNPSPRFGYNVPRLIEEAGLSSLMESCFDMSAQLYSTLQASTHPEAAAYATLMGHRIRTAFSVTFDELRSLTFSQAVAPELRNNLIELVAAQHPLIAEAIKPPTPPAQPTTATQPQNPNPAPGQPGAAPQAPVPEAAPVPSQAPAMPQQPAPPAPVQGFAAPQAPATPPQPPVQQLAPVAPPAAVPQAPSQPIPSSPAYPPAPQAAPPTQQSAPTQPPAPSYPPQVPPVQS